MPQIIDHILQVSFRPDRVPTIDEQASGAQALIKLNESFQNIARKLHVVSLYETKPTATTSRDRTEIVSQFGQPC
jgi:hypothetical protein